MCCVKSVFECDIWRVLCDCKVKSAEKLSLNRFSQTWIYRIK